jgi:hypothetical protein
MLRGVAEQAELIGAIQARLQRVTARRDTAELFSPAAEEEARRLTALAQDSGTDLAAAHTLGWLHWYRYLAASVSGPSGQDDHEMRAAVELFLPCFLMGSGELPGPALLLVADQAEEPAHAMLRQALGSPDGAFVTGVLELWQRIVAATPPDHPRRASRVSCLGNVFQIRFQRTGQLSDLDEAIRLGRSVLDALPAEHPVRGGLLANLGVALADRFERLGDPADLDEAIRVGREAVTATPPDDPERAARSSNLEDALRLRSERTG